MTDRDALIEAAARAMFESDHATEIEVNAVDFVHWTALTNVGRNNLRDEYRQSVRAALSAIEAAGWRVVPQHPTRNMSYAHLIAAAPDLAEALDLALARCIQHGDTETHPVVIAARSTLAKAKGETT
mgnify:FL=1